MMNSATSALRVLEDRVLDPASANDDGSGGLPPILRTRRSDPVYNCHSYLTKVPLGAIVPFLEAFTKPGDTVVDPFAGSGMTGIAAISVGRNAILSDISVLGRHIAMGYATRVDATAFRAAARSVILAARQAMGDLYLTLGDQPDRLVEMTRTVWSFTYECPHCRSRFVYFECLSPDGRPPASCSVCPEPFVRRLWTRRDAIPPLKLSS